MPPADHPNSPPDNESTERPAHREPVSLKRGREGSVDPFTSEAASAAYIAAKKNRLEEDAPEPQSETDEEKVTGKEGGTIGEVRRKVQEMNWKEGEQPGTVEDTEGDKDNADSKVESKAEGKTEGEDGEDWVKVDKTEASDTAEPGDAESDAPSLKRKADEPTAKVAEEKKRKSTSPTPTDSPPKPADPAPAEVKKPQATFGSFSAKASPFAAMAGTSAFGAAAKKESALDKRPVPFAGSGFGSYSSSFSPFASAKKSEDKAESSSFGDILKEKGDDADAAEDKKLQLDRQDVPTGEEEEETMYQTRAKLFMMEREGAWKERGVGLLKLNRRRDDGSSPRLVMRADGVLRVILNTGLYVGMSCLEDGKHVRMTIFEAGERRFVTIRTASTKIATELTAAIHEHTPLESPKKSMSPAGPNDSVV
ncbi:uncharacterized protein CcaverHIS019_0304070 [Cutaneotrichosporon cavernicola]|uniref:RanBD1 domain-containing protein n=1 Tax=Cutaneotrichosporon cavernicola TaxID=279322 RepID=A0AA48L299_9TREE|nr:uncharacterized protein CcaverHIS019_0304070 [Cutaneotrichosporon cavernicola]BEI90337.1 hypothetical protein CcaverHIS019_0304070 [Cutaneotrichosporon cavernicola]BEI98113.1 hypothetical protein CcaverHIS631_0304120 [Cutaneotrichosporon cavernicola]BEJ05890.1 hypothetical protein CcaverHIS641_0304120 [Cutaneotrichosporon cavernicola]